MNYVLITPARNEEAFIERVLESVVSQTRLPLKWVIVDDGSTDRMPDIVAEYAKRHAWIELVRMPTRAERHFAGKVHAFNAGLERVRHLQFDLVGNLDADISFSPDHFSFLIDRFAEDARLGLAGTAYTQDGWDSTKDSFEGVTSVHGACQLFRYQCYLDVGGYVANRAGGVDWIAVTTARMKGWKTLNFPQRRFHHYRIMGTAQRSRLGAAFDYGMKDYFLGGSPIWELCRVAYRSMKPPVVGGGIALLMGYSWAALKRVERPVSPELMRFHRREQMARLRTIIRSLLRLRLENYYVDESSETARGREPRESA
jgi:glycosyltransferase involved in cell wall biosynthesis